MLIRRIFAACVVLCAVLCALANPVFAQKTKAALTTEINTNWPDNSTGAITPAILRSTVLDIVNSYYDLNGGTSLACQAHQWVAGLPTLSSITCTQPAFADISGQATLSQLPTIGANTALCSIAGGTPIACTQAQLTALINLATSSLSGALPAWPNNTTTFFRGDGTYATLNFAAIGGQATLSQLPTIGANTVLGSIAGGTPAALSAVPLATGGLGGSQAAATLNQIPVYPGSSGAAVPTSGSTWLNAIGALSWSNDQHFGSGVPWVDVKSGTNGCAAAVGNGSTDDTTAIQCQINWMNTNLGGGVLFFPHGNYRVSSPGILVKGGILLQGSGRDASTISAVTDTNVVSFDSATCTFGIGMADLFVSGYQNVSAAQDNVVVGSNCLVTLSRNYVWGGHHALNTAGFDGTYTNNFFCGWTGDNVFSTGANWYFNDKLDSCGNPSTANGFEQGATSGIAENYIYRMDLSCGTCTNSIKINDTTGTHAYTFFYGVITSKPVVISNALVTSFMGGEFGSTSFTGSGSIAISGVRAASSTTPSGGTYNCGANFNLNCTLQNSGLAGAGATTVAGQTCTLGSTCGLSSSTGKISANVNLNNATFTAGPTASNGTTGTYLATGNVLVAGSAGDNIICKLWDGTTIITSGGAVMTNTNGVSIALSGTIATPAAAIRISCLDVTANRGTINASDGVDGNTASSVTALQIQ